MRSWSGVAGWLWLGVGAAIAQERHYPLNDGWQFQQVGKEHWYSAEVPGCVQTDLLRHGLIPDFMQRSNIDSVQWVENEDWIYKRTILVTDALLKHGHLDLVFKGLDTFAEVYINDSLIGKADNMFRTWEWPIKSTLRAGENELKVIFRSPIKEGAKLREAYGIQLPHDSDPSGVSPYIRKAAYQFGWDFCPRLVTSGIWKGVELRGWSQSRFNSFEVMAQPRGDSLSLFLRTHLSEPSNGTVRFCLDMNVLGVVPISNVDGTGFAGYRATVPLPDRWWPNGSGQRPLHDIRADLMDESGGLIQRSVKRTGFRTIELVQDRDSIGAQFNFRVNGHGIFIKGCNVVPPNLLVSESMDSTWVALVRMMQAASMNMARIWAGGVYPPDAFFDACDTAGILVWQDFMVGNMVPGGRDFLDNVSIEASEQLGRLRHHPSLALLCGDNELAVAWENWGWQQRYALHGVDSMRIKDDYDELHRRLGIDTRYVGIDYTPTSPLSNWGSTAGLRSGDLHYWGVWHGDSTFSSFQNNVGRFASEWGFQSYPDSALLAKYIHPDSLYLGSPAVKRLQRSYKTDRPIWEAIERELEEERPTTLGGFIEASQRAQAKAYKMAIDAHMDARPHCMGTLLWQLNDCWPGPSWSIIDYEGHPKPAYEAVKAAFAKP